MRWFLQCFCHAGPRSLVLFFSSRIVIYRSKCRRMDCNYGEVHCDSVKIADRSDSLRVHHKHVPWKIILVSYTRPLFRSTKANYFIGQLWQLLTASNVGALTQAWQAKRAVFKIPGFVTLGARDFSSAVSGFCQVFIVTRASPLVASAFGQHQKFPPHARKTSGTQGRGLSASVSFLSSPPLPALLLSPFFARSLTLVPRSLFLHRTETLATQATSSQVLLQIRIEHKEFICHRCIADWAKTLLSL